MVGFQKTFSLIPDLPSALNGNSNAASAGPPSRPPMTTKQAKKAYKAANKGPKISKAEQRRQDLMEQDRIRRELEKERNQARARSARDRRKAKEEKEKADKKKKGLPLVAVNPSQDTLARFMLKPASKKTEERNIPLPAPEDDDSDAISSPRDGEVRSAKRRRLDEPPKILERRLAPGQSIFTRPSSREAGQSQRNSCSGSTNAPRKESPTPRPRIYDLDDPSTRTMVEDQISNEPFSVDDARIYDHDDPSTTTMVEDQISNESFSVDDGLFDDFIIESVELEKTVREYSDSHQALPPAEPPDNGGCFSTQKASGAGEIDPLSPGSTSVAAPQLMSRCPPSLSARPEEPEVRSQVHSLNGVRTGLEQITTSAESSRHQGALENVFAASRVGVAVEHTTACIERENFLSTVVINSPENSASVEITEGVVRQDSQTDMQVPGTKQTLPIQAASTQKGQLTKETKGTVPRSKPKCVPWTPHIRQPLQDVSLNKIGFSNAKDLLPSKFSDKYQSAAHTSHTLNPSPNIPLSRAKAFLSPRTTAMAPPPLPPKFKSHSRPSPSHEVGGPRFLLQRKPPDLGDTKQSNPPGRPEQFVPPPSTQALLEGLSDLFPSPSQELKEIFETFTSREQWPSARLRPSSMATQFGPLTGANQSGHYTHSLSRHHAIGSSIRKTQITARQSSNLELAKNDSIAVLPTVFSKSRSRDVIDCMPFPSTQDLYLSSQDIKEIEESEVLPRKGPESPDTVLTSGSHPRISGSHFAPAPEASVRYCVIANEACTTPLHEERGSRTSGDEIPPTPVEAPLITEEDIEELLKYDDDESQDQTTKPADEPALQHQPPDLCRQSPKPFFTSSGNKEMMYLAIERIKTTAWEDGHVRRKAQEDLQSLLRAEEEKADRLLLEQMLQREEEAAVVSAEQPPEAVIDAMACQPCGLERSNPSSGRPQSQKGKGNSQRNQRSSHPQSSWDKMLELLAKTESVQAAPAPSQESDYGDALWDDVDIGLVDL